MNYKDLVKLINYHDDLYYDKGRTEIYDKQYDDLYALLEQTEEKQGWRDSESPTIKVGGHRGKIKHPHKLYSLNKVYNKTDVNREFTVETPKIDGTNLTVTYRKGRLAFALTRGDGEFGDSVTHLTPNIKGIPTKITSFRNVTFTGECVTDNGGIENFRNYVSGAIGLKEAADIKDRNIRYIVHDILGSTLGYKTRMEIATNEGFYTVIDEELCNKYPQDGIVYRTDSYKKQVQYGYTSKFPKFAVALKKREENTGIARLQRVEWSIGRTGTVNPVGIIEPIYLEDAKISRVTLHNMEFITSHKLGLGDLIEIERAGGVIPKVLRVFEYSTHNQKVTMQDAAVAIDEEVIMKGPKLYVKNFTTQGNVKLLSYFIKTIGIKGLGPKSIEKLGITHPVDLYTKQNYSILGVNGEKIIAEIERSKTKSYKVVLASLGIEGVGRTASEKIVNVLPFFSRLREIEYTDIPSIGPLTKEKILVWLDNNEDWVKKLPLQLEQNEEIVSVLINTVDVCISGKLDMSKRELTEILANYGYNVVSSVTKDCLILISDGKESGKYKTAVKKGIRIINYWDRKKEILKGQIE